MRKECLTSFFAAKMKERETFFADILLPLYLKGCFTYRIPVDLHTLLKPGFRVVVPFGNSKVQTGIVTRIHSNVPEFSVKYILEVLDEQPVVTDAQLKLFKWTAAYYMCTEGEVLNAALPSGLKISSESRIQIHPFFSLEDENSLTDHERHLLEALKEKEYLNYKEVGEILKIKSFVQVVRSLVQKEAVILFESVKDKFKPKRVKRIRFTPAFADEERNLEELFQSLEKKEKQLNVVMRYLQQVPLFKDASLNVQGIEKKVLLGLGVSKSSLSTLTKAGVFEEFEQEISRFDNMHQERRAQFELTAPQLEAKNSIYEQFNARDIVLFKGVTGSGKTEIYIELIQDVLDSGGQVLYLLPEIALTTQIVKRLRAFFGDQLGVYHSKYSDNERVEVWKGVLEHRFKVVVGVRSSVLLPFDNLAMVVVDESHETSFKQFDPAPRYHAVDVAMVLAGLHHAKVLLGSATPSFEQMYHARQGKYGYVELNERFGEAKLPEITFSDSLLGRKKKTNQGEFTKEMLEALQRTLEQNSQAILFQNRRGYSPYVACEDCGYIPECKQCAVSMTYHMYKDDLVCHYCGERDKIPMHCPACGSAKILTVGFGTEKLEEEIGMFLPDARTLRMDLDTTRNKNSYETIINEFAKGDVDVLIGTQMVSKGLDFDKVRLVGVFDVDRLIHFPDFRANERVFQLVTQVSGRAGRRGDKGLVIIQTNNPEQELLHQIALGDFESLYAQEIEERRKFNYPPFCRLIKIVLKHEDKKTAELASVHFCNILKSFLGAGRVLDAHDPVVSKIRNQHIREILLKIERNGISLNKLKPYIMEQAELLIRNDRRFRKLWIYFDVDPY